MLSPAFQAYHERSLVSSTSWAIGAHHHFFGDPSSPGGPLEPARFRGVVQSGERLTGGSFPDGRLYDPVTGQFSSLMAARAIAAGRTLHETHVNLETGVGQWLKATLQLPFQEHSRFSWQAGVEFAERMFGTVQGWKPGHFTDFNWKGRHYWGEDAEGAFTQARGLGGGAAEVFAHGGSGPQGQWLFWNQKGRQLRAERVVQRLAAEPGTHDLALHACNPGNHILHAPAGRRLTYGLGAGIAMRPGEWQVGREALLGEMAFTAGVGIAEGDRTQLYMKQVLQAQLQRGGLSLGGIEKPGGASRIGLVRLAGQSELHLTADLYADSVAQVQQYGRPLSQVPSITARRGFLGRTSYHLPDGARFRSLGAATQTLAGQVLQGGEAKAAATIAARGTLNELHVNLESGIGQFLKRLMRLPFKAHSRLDPLAAARQAEGVFGHFSPGEQEGRQLLVGARVGERAVSHLAQVELHAHGIERPGRLSWEVLDGAGQGTVPVQSVVNAVAQQGQADSLLITACNMDGRFVQAVGDLRVIQGLGKGYYHGRAREAVRAAGFGGFHSWRDAVVMHAGDDAFIYPKSAIHAELLRRGVYSGPVQSGLVGIGLDTEAGAPRIGSLPAEVTRESMLKSTLPLSEAPYIHARGFDSYGQGGQYQLATGERFGSLVEAEAALTNRLRATVDPSRLEQVSRYEASLGQAMGTDTGPLAPWQMTREAFVKEYGQSIIGGRAAEAAAEATGLPGYHLEVARAEDWHTEDWQHQAIVFRDAKGVARGSLYFSAPPGLVSEAGEASVLDVWVDPAFRGQGIGSGLYDLLEEKGFQRSPLDQLLLSKEGAALYHSRAVRQAQKRGSLPSAPRSAGTVPVTTAADLHAAARAPNPVVTPVGAGLPDGAQTKTAWLDAQRELIQAGQLTPENLSEEFLDTWQGVASRVELIGSSPEALAAYDAFMGAARTRLGMDVTMPQIGSPAFGGVGFQTLSGPLDGRIQRLDQVGIRSRDRVWRPAYGPATHKKEEIQASLTQLNAVQAAKQEMRQARVGTVPVTTAADLHAAAQAPNPVVTSLEERAAGRPVDPRLGPLRRRLDALAAKNRAARATVSEYRRRVREALEETPPAAPTAAQVVAGEAAAVRTAAPFTPAAVHEAASAAPAMPSAAERTFGAAGWAGIVLGGALIAGGLLMLRPDQKRARVPHAPPHAADPTGPTGPPESQTESTRTRRGRQPHERFSTQVTLHDAAPDWAYLDRLYSHQLS